MNVNIDKAVSNALNAEHNQRYSTPTDNSPTLTPENQLIANQITQQKPLGTIREKNPGNSLLTAQQKLETFKNKQKTKQYIQKRQRKEMNELNRKIKQNKNEINNKKHKNNTKQN